MEDDNLIQERKRKLEAIQSDGINPYPYTFKKKNSAKEIIEKYEGDSKLEPEQKTEDNVSVAGRIIFLRRMGKATFLHLLDETGKVQAYFREQDVGEEKYKLLKNSDIGDIIGVEGTIFATKTGETTIYVDSFDMLCKTLRPLPEKYHGIKDTELRYRRRYLDLIMNPEEREKFRMRTKIISLVRRFLDKKGFLEVETPVLQTIYGGTNAKPFKTHINAYDMQMYLRVAPELYLKRLLVGGFEKVYEIARNFRNEGADQTHNPEFTMIEWYEAYTDYHGMMDTTEELYKYVAQELFGKLEIQFGEKTIDLSDKWPRVTLIDSIKDYTGLDVNSMNAQELQKYCEENKIHFVGSPNWGILVFTIFDKLVADKLEGPIWIIDYPKDVSPLAKLHRNDPRLVERFECYIGGKEIGDGWSELISPVEQRARFENEQSEMRAGNEEAHPKDEDFIEALEYGMPPTGGIGIGIDRLVMLFTNRWSIRDVMFFPIMKPRNDK